MDTGTKASKTTQLRIVQGRTTSTAAARSTAARRDAPRPPPREPEGGEGEEVEDGLAGEDREAPQQARGEGGPRPALPVGGEQALHGPPQQDGEDRLGPEVGREPDELGVEGRDPGGDEAGPLPEDAAPGEAEGGHEEDAGEALRVLHRLEGAEEGEGHADEVEVERRVEDEAQPQRREARPRARGGSREPQETHIVSSATGNVAGSSATQRSRTARPARVRARRPRRKEPDTSATLAQRPARGRSALPVRGGRASLRLFAR